MYVLAETHFKHTQSFRSFIQSESSSKAESAELGQQRASVAKKYELFSENKDNVLVAE